MSTLIEIEAADRGVYLRASRQKVVSQMSFAGRVIVADLASDDSLVGLTVSRLGSIELQVLSDLARTYALDFGALLATRDIELACSAQGTMLPTQTPNEYWESVKRSEQWTAERLNQLKQPATRSEDDASQERGWLAEEMRRTSEEIQAMPNGHALVKEAGIRSEDENRSEAAAFRVSTSLRSALRKARHYDLER